MAPRSRDHARSSTSDATLLAADRVLSRANDYHQGIKRVHAASLILAERIARGSDIESTLLKGTTTGTAAAAAGGDDNEDAAAAEFILESRNRLKQLAKDNTRINQEIENFISALSSVRDEIYAKQTAAMCSTATTDGDGTPQDYEQYIKDKMSQVKRRLSVREDLEDSAYSREVRSRLGEKERKKKRYGSGRGRRSNASSVGSDDDDDDLEVMTSQVTSEAALKCPITGMMFEDPVKSKHCGHTYSRAGLAQMWKNRKRKCPVSGCANQNVDEAQIEEDLEMVMKVKRFKRRQELERRQRAMDDEEDDDEVDETGGGGMTVIE